MPGAGGIRAANFLAESAPKDGTAIGTFARGIGDPNRAVHNEWLRILYEWGGVGLGLWFVFIFLTRCGGKIGPVRSDCMALVESRRRLKKGSNMTKGDNSSMSPTSCIFFFLIIVRHSISPAFALKCLCMI